ncbi:DUF1501 domain-containing protein [Humisphaera borealis]|uniref:DUF1501 domain-containing protein n=1 Tax=Humisphaera borealis TaxID=2807512 RepID=A0A7M2X2C3_9BACT|nr:DUF1501 domain-containing protein [Humisphaera borealis]QOV91759.1 DUF1501 domain-containing protein [Humisphaera borealis]
MTPANPLITRRDWLRRSGGGLGMIGLATMLAEQGLLATTGTDPMTPKVSHFPAKAKSVIWIFINGGPSHVDTWEHKPGLEKADGQELSGMDPQTGFFKNAVGPLMKSPFKFTPRGKCGKMVSSLFPHLGEHVDKMAFVHSGFTESNNHSPALFMMNCGLPKMGLPCVGSWVTYGLGSESRDLPGFVVMSDPKLRGLPKGNASNWSAGFLPGTYQGTYLSPVGAPIANLSPAAAQSATRQRAQLDLIAEMNRQHQAKLSAEAELTARIESFELAYRMQSAAPEALDIDREPDHIKKLYGIDDPKCAHVARQCLMARRLVERGVRFVQIYSGGMENERSWDGHVDIAGNHTQFAGETDQPVAGLLADLAQRGLLDDTLVVWGGEFGRLPVSQKGAKPGRDHNPHAFTMWFAGGGVKAGTSYGATDEVGFKAAENRAHVNDIHATLLHLLGLDHEKLTYRFNGRDFRLTDVAGRVIRDIVA